MMNRIHRGVAMLAMVCLIAMGLLVGCSKKENTEQSSNTTAEKSSMPATAATPIDPSTVASVNGTVKLDGAAPKAQKIDMSQDPACKGDNMAETMIADSSGDLANVFVYV